MQLPHPLPVPLCLAAPRPPRLAHPLPLLCDRQVVKAVAAAGVGVCDAASIRSVGVSLSAHFSPCASAKTAAEAAAKALAALASPIRPVAPADKPPADGPGAAAPPSAASAASSSPRALLAAVDGRLDLPPEVQLAVQAAPVTVREACGRGRGREGPHRSPSNAGSHRPAAAL